jgi:outer membrane protein OmpA-like peptidoglycan-associated protein
MTKITKTFLLASVSILLILSGSAIAQQPTVSNSIQNQGTGDNPIYRITINVVERQATAINYKHRSGSTTVDFRGTPLLPKARGEAKVESKQGYIEVEVEFDDLQPATRFGSEYLTYVMWAISPEGRAVNLGEVILNGTKSKLDVSSDLQAFGLIVTAEPYFAVTQPSDVVVMENFIRPETRGLVEQIDAKYELLQRGQYTTNVPPADLKPLILDSKTPLDVYEARNAVRIARWAGADQYAADSLSKAEQFLKDAEDNQNHHSKTASMMARQAVQTAEDSRLIALKRISDNRLAQERAAAASRESEEKAKADRARAEAEQAELLRGREAQRAAAANASRAAAEAEAARAVARAKADSDRAVNAANEKHAAEADAERARQTAMQAEREKQELRQQLITQFNAILQTRDSPRGLIVNMSDVVFDTGQFTLKPGAREKLAKISGIVQAHPGLKIEVEGHTDSVGSDALNQKLSENRADAVRTFLVQSGVNPSMIVSRGFGKDKPVASNDSAAGRQLNRRVEMVVSGEIISGTPLTSSLSNN